MSELNLFWLEIIGIQFVYLIQSIYLPNEQNKPKKSKEHFLPSLREGRIGGETNGPKVSKSKRPVRDWAFSSQ